MSEAMNDRPAFAYCEVNGVLIEIGTRVDRGEIGKTPRHDSDLLATLEKFFLHDRSGHVQL